VRRFRPFIRTTRGGNSIGLSRQFAGGPEPGVHSTSRSTRRGLLIRLATLQEKSGRRTRTWYCVLIVGAGIVETIYGRAGFDHQPLAV
jgi:hypothetical protein